MTTTAARLLSIGALGAGLAFAFPAVAQAHDLTEPTVSVSHGTTTLKFSSTQDSFAYIPKGGEPTQNFPEGPPAVGDAFSFTESLFQGAAKIGYDTGKCTITGETTSSCVIDVTYSNGTVHVTGENADGPSRTFNLVSGTGAYAGIAGKATAVDVDDTHTNITAIFTTAAASQVSAVPAGGAAAGGGHGSGTDSALLIGVGVAAVGGGGGLFAAARYAARRD
jgi:hypothetical protein